MPQLINREVYRGEKQAELKRALVLENKTMTPWGDTDNKASVGSQKGTWQRKSSS